MKKKYGVKLISTEYVYYADREWYATCRDEDGKFGTDSLNEAYQFAQGYSYQDDPIEVFEK